MPLVDDSGESSVIDLDDSEAADIDPGIAIDDSLTMGDEPAPELVFDIGELLSPIDESETGDDMTGPETPPDADLPELEHNSRSDEDEACELDNLPDALDLGTLPELDADALGDTGIEQDAQEVSEICDDPLPPWSEAPWAESFVPAEQGFRCLALGAKSVVLGGSVVRWLDAATREPRREIALESPAVSCALPHHGALWVSDARGELLYALRSDAELRAAPGLRATRSPSTRGTTTLELHVVPSERGNILLGLTSEGRLLVGSEQGHWSPMELHGRVLALGSSGGKCIALLQSRRGRILVTSADGGANWSTLDTPREVQDMVGDEPPMLAATSSAVLVAHRLRGTVLSTDSGRTFERVAGCNNVSAVCGGELGGLPAFWLALYSDTSETASIVLLRAPAWHPARIGEIRASGSEHSDEDGVGRRALAMGWDSLNRRLWAAGEFGAASWEPLLTPLVS